MSTDDRDPSSDASAKLRQSLVFLYTAYELPGIAGDEVVEYYSTSGIERLRHVLTTETESLFDFFGDSYDLGECFALADYGTPEDSLETGEEAVFRAALDEDERSLEELSDLHPSSQFDGYRAVIGHRIKAGAVANLPKGLELFNFVMECGISVDQFTEAFCCMRLQSPRDFVPCFLDRVWNDEDFQAHRPLPALFREQVQHPQWPQTDLMLGKFLLVVDYFTSLWEKRSW